MSNFFDLFFTFLNVTGQFRKEFFELVYMYNTRQTKLTRAIHGP